MNKTTLIKWHWKNRFWHPQTFPNFFKDLQTVFPDLHVEFYQATQLPKTIFGQPKDLATRTRSQETPPAFNYFHTSLLENLSLEAWGTPYREQVTILEQKQTSHPENSNSIWNDRHPIHDALMTLLRHHHLITKGRYLGNMLVIILLLMIPYQTIMYFLRPWILAYPFPQFVFLGGFLFILSILVIAAINTRRAYYDWPSSSQWQQL